MKTGNRFILICTIFALVVLLVSAAEAQRFGGMAGGSMGKSTLISNGPKGPIHGGESAVTDMILMDDGWVYGSTEATWGAKRCHLFRTNGDSLEHVQCYS